MSTKVFQLTFIDIVKNYTFLHKSFFFRFLL